MVFFISHNLFVFCKFVLVPTKMKYAMYHNSVYFIFESLTVFFGVFCYAVYAYVYLANQLVSNRVVKGYDVCICIVIKKFKIYFNSCFANLLMHFVTASSVFKENVPTD